MKNRLMISALAVAVWLSVAVSGRSSGKTPTYTPVSLSVVINDTDSGNGEPYQIRSDSGGPYVDTVNGVSAQINQYGILMIGFGPHRGVYFDYSQRYDQPQSVATSGLYAAVNLSIQVPSTPLQAMGNGTSQCVPLGWFYTDHNGIDWRDTFQFPGSSTGKGGTALITRSDNSTWFAVAANNTCGVSDDPAPVWVNYVTRLSGKRYTVTDAGEYYVPFNLTMTKK
jgi:hypothetical protein